MMVQTKCKLNNTELFLKLFHIQCTEIGNKNYEETTELAVNAIECLKTDYLRKRSTEF